MSQKMSTIKKTIRPENKWQDHSDYILGMLSLSLKTPITDYLKLITSPDVVEWAELRYEIYDSKHSGRNPHAVLIKLLEKIPNEVLETQKTTLQKLMHSIYTVAPETLGNSWNYMGALVCGICENKPSTELEGWQLSIFNILTNRE